MSKVLNLEPFYQAIQTNQYIHIGQVKQPIGTQGAFAMALLDDIDNNNIAQIPALFIEKSYTKIPYHIQAITITNKKIIVQCTHIQTKTEAYTLYNLSVYLPKSLENLITSSTKMDKEIINYLVKDTKNISLGYIQTIYTGHMHNIISVNFQGKALLIPYCPPFIVDINRAHKEITIELPENYIETMLSAT